MFSDDIFYFFQMAFGRLWLHCVPYSSRVSIPRRHEFARYHLHFEPFSLTPSLAGMVGLPGCSMIDYSY